MPTSHSFYINYTTVEALKQTLREEGLPSPQGPRIS